MGQSGRLSVAFLVLLAAPLAAAVHRDCYDASVQVVAHPAGSVKPGLLPPPYEAYGYPSDVGVALPTAPDLGVRLVLADPFDACGPLKPAPAALPPAPSGAGPMVRPGGSEGVPGRPGARLGRGLAAARAAAPAPLAPGPRPGGLTHPSGPVALAARGNCSFDDKARNVEGAGYGGLLLFDPDLPSGCVWASTNVSEGEQPKVMVVTVTRKAGEALAALVAEGPADVLLWAPPLQGTDPAPLLLAAMAVATVAAGAALSWQDVAIEVAGEAASPGRSDGKGRRGAVVGGGPAARVAADESEAERGGARAGARAPGPSARPSPQQRSPDDGGASEAAAASGIVTLDARGALWFVLIASGALLLLFFVRSPWVITAVCAGYALACWEPLAAALDAAMLSAVPRGGAVERAIAAVARRVLPRETGGGGVWGSPRGGVGVGARATDPPLGTSASAAVPPQTAPSGAAPSLSPPSGPGPSAFPGGVAPSAARPRPAPAPAPAALVAQASAAASGALSAGLCVLWLFSRSSTWSWTLQDALGVALLLTLLRDVRLPNLRVACVLLPAAALYDAWWVFVQPAVTGGASVMVSVAARGDPGDRLPLALAVLTARSLGDDPPLALLGLGDIALPGVLVALCARWDAARAAERARDAALSPGTSCQPFLPGADGGAGVLAPGGASAPPLRRDSPVGPTPPRLLSSVPLRFTSAPAARFSAPYAIPAVLAYAVGLALTYLALALGIGGDQGQPALIYLVPCTLGTTVVLSLARGDFWDFWAWGDEGGDGDATLVRRRSGSAREPSPEADPAATPTPPGLRGRRPEPRRERATARTSSPPLDASPLLGTRG